MKISRKREMLFRFICNNYGRKLLNAIPSISGGQNANNYAPDNYDARHGRKNRFYNIILSNKQN